MIERFLKTYRSYRKAVSWFSEKKAKGESTDHALDRFRVVESNVNHLWAQLSGENKAEATRQLVKEGLLPREYLELIDVFGGRVATFTGKETKKQVSWRVIDRLQELTRVQKT